MGRLLLTVSLVPLALAAGCAVNPVTGQRELVLVSEQQEVGLGAEADKEIVAQYGQLQDPRLEGYVSELGQRLVGVSHRKELKFTFRVLDDPVVNAFALPGGYCYITRGILPWLDSEAALAGVMGHEVGHVTARHGAKRMSKQVFANLGLGVVGAVSERLASGVGILSAAANLLLLKYSRDDERQSDELGVQYATALGYDTRDMARFFQTLGTLSGNEGGGLPAWTSTHPDPGERHETVLRLTQEEQQKRGPGPYVIKREELLARVDGLVFGTDPRQGYVQGTTFFHPGLRFQFPVPGGWKVDNGRSQVVMQTAQGDQAVVFTQAEGASPQAAADAFAKNEGVTVVSRADLTVGGSPAHRLVARVAQQGQEPIGLTSTYIAFAGKVWAFHGLAQDKAFAQAQAGLDAPANGFAPLTDPAALGVQPIVVRVVKAEQAGPFSQVVARWPIPQGADIDVARLALMNGLKLEDPVEAGRSLKVLARGQSGSK